MSESDTPEFLKALNEACERRYRGYLYGGEFAKAHSKDTIAETMEEMQKQRMEIEASVDGLRGRADQLRREARIMTDPHMREITMNLRKGQVSRSLVCPVCGEGDHGNRMNGKPICFMNARHKGLGPIPLMTPEEAKDWKLITKKDKHKEPWELDDTDIVRVK